MTDVTCQVLDASRIQPDGICRIRLRVTDIFLAGIRAAVREFALVTRSTTLIATMSSEVVTRSFDLIVISDHSGLW